MTKLPPPLSTEAAWKGPTIKESPEKWTYTFTHDDIVEINQAISTFLSSASRLEDISKHNFHLPLLGGKLARIKSNLTNGMGFTLIKGLDISLYSREEIATLFMGIGSYLGIPRSQNAAGHLLGHVRDIGEDENNPNSRIYQTNSRQTFHTDSADIVGLICLKTAKSGGESLLVSAETIYNEMLKRRPDLVELLFSPVATDKRGEVEPGQKPFFTIPVFSWFKEKLSVIYQRQYIDSGQRFKGVPELPDNYTEALNLFDQLANDESLNISMKLEPGDMQFVHNHSMLHDRTGFLDWPELENRRHLLRLWLSAPGDRELPPIFKERYGNIEIGNRGGVIVEGTKLHAPLD